MPKHELQPCLYYEYARECELAQSDRALWLRHFSASPTWPSWREVATAVTHFGNDATALLRFDHSPLRIIAAIDHFPSTPWLGIPEVVRANAMIQCDWNSVERMLAYRKKKPVNPSLAGITFEQFPIRDWSWTDEELVEYFRLWLRKTRPQSQQPNFKQPGRRDSPDDLLSHLGILRLFRYAKAMRGDGTLIEEVSMDRANIYRAKRKAEAFLTRFYSECQ